MLKVLYDDDDSDDHSEDESDDERNSCNSKAVKKGHDKDVKKVKARMLRKVKTRMLRRVKVKLAVRVKTRVSKRLMYYSMQLLRSLRQLYPQHPHLFQRLLLVITTNYGMLISKFNPQRRLTL
jgi:predicted DNA binding CopG/RHH family protein